jgi:hypothetical protein
MNVNRRIICIVSVLSLIGSCKCNKEQKQAGDTTIVTDTAEGHPLSELSQMGGRAEWEGYYASKHPSFSLSKFNETNAYQTEITTRTVTLSKQYYDNYGRLLEYNKDSSRFLDIFSYGWIIEKGKDGGLVAREGEPDKEAAVVDPKTGKRSRLLFCGPACSFEKAVWIDEATVAIMGLTDEEGDGSYVPAVWIINTMNGNSTMYEYGDQMQHIHPGDYTRVWLVKKGIKPED